MAIRPTKPYTPQLSAADRAMSNTRAHSRPASAPVDVDAANRRISADAAQQQTLLPVSKVNRVLPRQIVIKRPQENDEARSRDYRGQKRKTPEDPSNGWQEWNPTQKIRIQSTLSHGMLPVRVRLFCALAMAKLKNKIRASEGDEGSVVVISMFMKDELLQLRKCLNSHVTLHELGCNPTEHFEMCQFLAVVLFSCLSVISLEKALNALSRYDCITSGADR